VPQLTLVWPTVPEYHPDTYALNVLLNYLIDGKRAPMNEVLIDEKALTTRVSGFNYNKELAGEVYFFINPNPGDDIDKLLPGVWEAFERFEQNGISDEALNRIKTQAEVGIFDSLQSALGKAIALGEYNVFTDDPGFYAEEIQSLQNVTKEDVMAVYKKYIKGKHYVATSFVPKGQVELGIEQAQVAQVVEEVVEQGAEKEVPYDPTARIFEPSPSAFDRSVEPPFGESFDLPSPQIWRHTSEGGLKIFGIQSNEVPLIEFSLEFDAGKMRSPIDKPGLATMTGDMLTKGAGELDVAGFEDALGALGSSLYAQTNGRYTVIRGKTLARNLEQTVSLLQDMIIAPTFDQKEFEILKEQYLQDTIAQLANPNFIAARELANIMYNEPTPLASVGAGNEQQVQAITLDDVKAFHASYYSMANAKLNIVGAFDKQQSIELFSTLKSPVKEPLDEIALPTLKPVTASQIYFYDVPESKQSVVLMRRPALAMSDDNFAELEALNFPLGGIYTSKLMTELRVNKGYTYGIRSSVFGNDEQGQFGISTSVRTNVTTESIALINQILSDYPEQMTLQDLAQTKDALLRGQALKNETLGDKLGLLLELSRNALADDAQSQNMANIQAMDVDTAKKIIQSHIKPDAMNIIIVGDAATQFERLESLNIGKPILLN
jgi:zinc protease